MPHGQAVDAALDAQPPRALGLQLPQPPDRGGVRLPLVQQGQLLRGAAVALVALGAWPAATGGHPGHGAAEVRIANLSYSPEEIVVVTGDSVLWFWDGGETNHSVTSDPGQAESFDSDPDKPADQVRHRVGDAFGHKFTREGTFTYTCKVHSFMKGRVVVKPASQPDPPAPDPTPAPDGSTVAVTDLSLRPASLCRSRRGCPSSALLRFTLSDTATVRVRLLRGARQVRAWRLERDGGRHRLRIRARGLRPARYQLVVQATTPDGARSPAVTRRLRVR